MAPPWPFSGTVSAPKPVVDDPPASKAAATAGSLSHAQVAILLFVAGIGARGGYRIYQSLLRIPNSEYVTPDVLAKRRWVRGVVTRCVCGRPDASAADGGRA
jgi:hypothetical protein